MKKLILLLLVLGSISVSASAQEQYTAFTQATQGNLGFTYLLGPEIEKAEAEARAKASKECKNGEETECQEVETKIVRIFTGEEEGYLTTRITVKSIFTASKKSE